MKICDFCFFQSQHGEDHPTGNGHLSNGHVSSFDCVEDGEDEKPMLIQSKDLGLVTVLGKKTFFLKEALLNF